MPDSRLVTLHDDYSHNVLASRNNTCAGRDGGRVRGRWNGTGDKYLLRRHRTADPAPHAFRRNPMSHLPHPSHTVRPATKTDVVGARQVMLDTFYRDFGYGYVPEWHRDVIDIEGTYLGDPRHLLLVAVHDSEVVHDRHHGLARTLVVKACDFAADAPGYDSIYLHTNVNIEGAEAFWRSMAKEVFDARTTGEHGPGVGTIHFEIPMPQAAAPDEGAVTRMPPVEHPVVRSGDA
ncbi:hypothetical protein [Streptomyces sanglieri]